MEESYEIIKIMKPFIKCHSLQFDNQNSTIPSPLYRFGSKLPHIFGNINQFRPGKYCSYHHYNHLASYKYRTQLSDTHSHTNTHSLTRSHTNAASKHSKHTSHNSTPFTRWASLAAINI